MNKLAAWVSSTSVGQKTTNILSNCISHKRKLLGVSFPSLVHILFKCIRWCRERLQIYLSWGFSFPLTKPPGNARLILVERSMGAACRWRRFKITWGNEKPYYRIAFLYLILDERGKKDFLNLCFPFLIFRIKSTAMISERSPRIRNIQFQNLSGSLSQ